MATTTDIGATGMNGVEYKTTDQGIAIVVDGETIGHRDSVQDAQRFAHAALMEIVRVRQYGAYPTR